MEQEIIDKIVVELSLCYEHLGRKAPESVTIIAASLQDAIHFQSLAQVHECFKRAKDIESIPTQKTLKEAFKNYGEEFLKYNAEGSNENKALEFHDSREAWLPKESVKQNINLRTAIKNYCGAIGGKMYLEYCRSHETDVSKAGDKRVVTWKNRDKAEAFDNPIIQYLVYLYEKYWRKLPIANGYPEDKPLSICLIPPTTQEFQTMLKAEGVI